MSLVREWFADSSEAPNWYVRTHRSHPCANLFEWTPKAYEGDPQH